MHYYYIPLYLYMRPWYLISCYWSLLYSVNEYKIVIISYLTSFFIQTRHMLDGTILYTSWI
jgi:hypothetical protein